jgi:hypothetical protein
MHGPVPGPALNLPASHCEQGPPLGPVDPALQAQVVKDVPGGEFEFGGQVVQALDATDPGGDLGVSALGQSVHKLALVAPVKLENLPVQHHQGSVNGHEPIIK